MKNEFVEPGYKAKIRILPNFGAYKKIYFFTKQGIRKRKIINIFN